MWRPPFIASRITEFQNIQRLHANFRSYPFFYTLFGTSEASSVLLHPFHQLHDLTAGQVGYRMTESPARRGVGRTASQNKSYVDMTGLSSEEEEEVEVRDVEMSPIKSKGNQKRKRVSNRSSMPIHT